MSLHVDGVDPILFDMGTGLRYFGNTLEPDAAFTGTVLLSHLHWDHIQGLPFFKPLLKAGSQVAMYAPTQEDGLTVEQVFADTIRPPLFPVDLAVLPGTIVFHELWDDDIVLADDVCVMSRPIPHVGNTIGYRVTARGASVAYLSDHQMPVDGSFSATQGALDLCRDVDLLIHDAQYTPNEFAMKRDWGHCTIEYAVWLAAECGAKRLALFHHDPTHDDAMLDRLTDGARRCGSELGVDVFAAREGMVVPLLGH